MFKRKNTSELRHAGRRNGFTANDLVNPACRRIDEFCNKKSTFKASAKCPTSTRSSEEPPTTNNQELLSPALNVLAAPKSVVARALRAPLSQQ
jgi:hypothetical protein